jgi:TatA/E family protein of Tat protein translocase
MFGMGMTEILVILAVALIVIGPKKLPDLAKSLGRALGEFRKATTDLKESLIIDPEIKEGKTSVNSKHRETDTPSNKNPNGDKVPAEDGSDAKTVKSASPPKESQESDKNAG